MKSIGNRIAPWRFLLFFALLILGGIVAIPTLGAQGALIAFDLAAVTFLATLAPLFRCDAKALRQAAIENDANRVILLVVSFLLTLVILAAIVNEMGQREALSGIEKAVVAISLVLVWTFGNAVYTLHYSHLFYTADDGGKDCAGLDFPKTRYPLLSDFTYFAFTLGVAVQTSDVCITSPHIRKVATAHCVAGFFFNLGVLALTINVLGQG